MISGLLIAFSVLKLIAGTNNCPLPELIEPCVCEDSGIICGGHSDIDLVNIFQTLEKKLTESVKHFKSFYLNNTFITELKENTFKDITFDRIVIEYCNNLNLISKDTFLETNKITKVLIIRHNRVSTSPDYSIFEAITKFISLEYLALEHNCIEEIPDYAFKSKYAYQDKLTDIHIRGYF